MEQNRCPASYLDIPQELMIRINHFATPVWKVRKHGLKTDILLNRIGGLFLILYKLGLSSATENFFIGEDFKYPKFKPLKAEM